MPPLAYLLTFRCYGTYLPGDPRGYVNRHHNTPGHAFLAADPRREAAVLRTLPQPPQILDGPARAAVDASIRQSCARAGWTLHALHVRTNHLHAVVSGTEPPERIMGSLKAWATRRLRNDGLVDSQTRPWSRHGSTRWLWTERAVEDACRYVVEGQGAELAGRHLGRG
jgi:REP element-mobilizing transposase RayT